MPYLYDYKLTIEDSRRIACDVPPGGLSVSCGKPATTGQNDGTAPFLYRCDTHAHNWRTAHRPSR